MTFVFGVLGLVMVFAGIAQDSKPLRGKGHRVLVEAARPSRG